MRRLAALVGALGLVAALGLTAPAGAIAPAPGGGRGPTVATPGLIQHAVRDGVLSRSEGLRQLAFALFAPEQLAEDFRSGRRWSGTVPLLRLQEGVAALPAGPLRSEIEALMAPRAGEEPATVHANAPGDSVEVNAETPPDGASRSCQNYSGATTNIYTSTHFYIEYDAADLTGTSLTAEDYADSLETSWSTEIGSFGWAAPPVAPEPAPGNRIHVRLEPLGVTQLGFTTNQGRHAGLVGNNPNTPWADRDAYASCIVLNTQYGTGASAQQTLDATTSHELNHVIQIGLGALTGDDRPDLSFIEALSTWIEDEVFDDSDYAENYLWPDFQESLGDYDDADNPYALWIAFRGMAERFGTTVAGGSEDAYQNFWERIGQFGVNDNGRLMLDALDLGLRGKGVSLADAFHAYAIATKFVRPCSGGYAYPHCFEEAARYRAAAGVPPFHTSVLAVGQQATGSIEDNYAINWVRLPTNDDAYRITLSNTAASGAGQIRGSVVCDTGSGFRIVPFPAVVAGGASTRLASFDPTGCSAVAAVLTNQAQTAANPETSASRSYRVSTVEADAPPSWRGGVVRGNQWFLRDVAETLPTGTATHSFVYGDPGDWPLMCDWDGDGIRTPGVRRGITFYLRDSNSSGAATQTPIPFGDPGDVPVCGDWDGNGTETVGVVRGGEWFLRQEGGAVEHRFFGDRGDVPVVGDWDGDGDADVGVRRGITFYLRSASGSGVADRAPFAYGDPGDIPFASDPDRDARFSVGVHRRGQWFLLNPAASSFYGDAFDRPVIWFTLA